MNVWSDKEPLSNPLISPIYGIKQGLPPIIMFGGVRKFIIQICNVWHMNWKCITNLYNF